MQISSKYEMRYINKLALPYSHSSCAHVTECKKTSNVWRSFFNLHETKTKTTKQNKQVRMIKW